MRFGFRIPSTTKRFAARGSVKSYILHNLGIKAPKGLGWITDPKKALYNRMYTRTTRGCMLHIILLLSVVAWMLVACDLQPKKQRSGKPLYVGPSVDYRGRVRKGYVRMPVSTKKNAVRNQGKSRYYYETRGKYRTK